MARKMISTLVDDIDGSTTQASTHTLTWDGASYKIDLSEANAAKITAALQPVISHGRPLHTTPGRVSAPAKPAVRATATTAKTAAKATRSPAKASAPAKRPSRRTNTDAATGTQGAATGQTHDAASRTGSPAGSPPPAPEATVSPAEIRNWWSTASEDLHLPQFRVRGAIPDAVRTAYHAAHTR